jgi:hypothetical protein
MKNAAHSSALPAPVAVDSPHVEPDGDKRHQAPRWDSVHHVTSRSCRRRAHRDGLQEARDVANSIAQSVEEMRNRQICMHNGIRAIKRRDDHGAAHSAGGQLQHEQQKRPRVMVSVS